MKDVFKVVTDQILSQLNSGIVPWRRPWSTNGPTSYATNKEYQGINTILLQANYESPNWLTFRQAQKMGGAIKAGEKGRPIVFADRVVKEEQNEKGEVSLSFSIFSNTTPSLTGARPRACRRRFRRRGITSRSQTLRSC
jgi:antirestriction protein ArdC